MRNISIKHIIYGGFLSFLCLSGCITEYTPDNIEEIDNLIIVDGTITDGVSTFQLGYSVGIIQKLTGDETIDNAAIYIETEDGTQMNGDFIGKGLYTVNTGNLNPDSKYRLRISINGNEYQSSFLSPLITPEIDSIFPMKKGPGEPVFMCIDTKDTKNQSRYYRWSYKENWEVMAELYANAGVDDFGNLVYYDLISSNNTYYCWGRDSSKTLILASSEKLSSNIISQKRLVEIPCDNDKLSVLYHISVEQMLIRKEAYDYFQNLQKNVEQTGSIFSPVPSEMKGNIECITNPDLPVIGYIEVSTKTTKELFIPENRGLYESPSKYCSRHITSDPDFAYPNYAYYYVASGSPPEYAPFECVDCRRKFRASKNKPDFWPNNHL